MSMNLSVSSGEIEALILFLADEFCMNLSVSFVWEKSGLTFFPQSEYKLEPYECSSPLPLSFRRPTVFNSRKTPKIFSFMISEKYLHSFTFDIKYFWKWYRILGKNSVLSAFFDEKAFELSQKNFLINSQINNHWELTCKNINKTLSVVRSKTLELSHQKL